MHYAFEIKNQLFNFRDDILHYIITAKVKSNLRTS